MWVPLNKKVKTNEKKRPESSPTDYLNIFFSINLAPQLRKLKKNDIKLQKKQNGQKKVKKMLATGTVKYPLMQPHHF